VVVPVEVVVGIVGRAHGLGGEVSIDPRTDEPERRFAPGQVLRSEDDGRTFTVESCRDHGGRLLVRFRELGDRTRAEAARGVSLVADVDPDEHPVEKEEFYDRQLVGLRVLDDLGTDIGSVAAVLHLPAQDLLEIDTGEDLRLVPFVAALVPEVDLGAGCLRLSPVGGLLEDEPE
jgi:16S rRNA processing protein RimM